MENRISIISSLTCGKSVTILPEHISSNTAGLQGSGLPGTFDGGFGGCNAVFLEDTRFPDGGADGAVVSYPAVAPVICFTPCERQQRFLVLGGENIQPDG